MSYIIIVFKILNKIQFLDFKLLSIKRVYKIDFAFKCSIYYLFTSNTLHIIYII